MRKQKFSSAQTESRVPQLLFWLSVLLFLAYAAYFYRGAYSIFDDSFITFRYADNLAHGHGYLSMLVGEDDYKNFSIRFLLPLLPLIYFSGAMGLSEKLSNLTPSRRAKALIALAGVWMMLLVGWSAPERNTYNTIINLHWIDLAQWVQARAQPTDTLAVDTAGILPFYTGLTAVAKSLDR